MSAPGVLFVHERAPQAGARPSPDPATGTRRTGTAPAGTTGTAGQRTAEAGTAEAGTAEAGAAIYLLVHGSMDRSTSFVRLAARLPDATVITYDRRGYAGSSARAPSESFGDQISDLLEVLAGRPVVAFGHSFGGDVVLGAAQQHPELIRAAVVWEAPMPWLASWPSTSAGGAVVASAGLGNDADVAEAFMRRMISDRIWERLPAATRKARRREGPALIAEMRALRASPPWDPAMVSIPVIVGAGEASQEHHRRSAVQLASALPDAELVWLPGARHGAHLSHPAAMAALLHRVARRAGMATSMPTSPEATAGPLGVGPHGGASSTSGPCAPTTATDNPPRRPPRPTAPPAAVAAAPPTAAHEESA